MPFTSEEVRSVDYMIESYNLSKETFVFSEENDDLFRRLFQDSGGSGQGQGTSSGSKYSYNKLDLSSLIMTLMKKNVFFVTSIDKEGISFQMLIHLSAKLPSHLSLQIARCFNYSTTLPEQSMKSIKFDCLKLFCFPWHKRGGDFN